MKKILSILLIILVAFSFCACNAKVNVSLKANQSGIVDLNLELDPMLSQYIFDLQSSFTNMSEDEAKGFLAPDVIKQAFAASQSVEVKEVVSKENSIKIKLAFKALNDVVSEGNTKIEAQDKDQIREVMDFVNNSNGSKKVYFHLNKEKFNNLLAMIPAEYQPMVAAFAPPGYDVEKEDYLEMLALNFIEYDSEYMKNKIRTAKFIFSFDIAGQILDYKGGKKVGNKIVYEIPLLDLLVMSDEYNFEVTFK